MPTFVRSDQAQISVEVEGVTIDKESWGSMEGGDNVAEEATAFPGGMKPQVALGGFPKRGPLTITRPWADTLINVYKALDGRVGLSKVTASYQNLNANKEAVYTPYTYTGVLTSVLRPNYKAGTSEEAHLTITIATDGEIS
jgi:hypothetical protein